ncbi:stonin-2 [Hyla sarda]|uniref:stonin-2 n=1 Tax=Hyla sarda TaxID=327740 RepID=UPI0024C2106A|nr:stonin-2 [Hyla sarda]
MTSLGESGVTQKSQWVSFNDDVTVQGQFTVDKSRKPPQRETVQTRSEGPGVPNITTNSRLDCRDGEPSPLRSDVFCWVQCDERRPEIPPSPWKPQKHHPGNSWSAVRPDRPHYTLTAAQRSMRTAAQASDPPAQTGRLPTLMTPPVRTPLVRALQVTPPPPQGYNVSSTDNSSFQEDEDLDMESVNWSSTVNGHPAPCTRTRFPSWVTFEDENLDPTPKDSPHRSSESSQSPSTPDRNFNSVRALKKRERPKSSLVDLSRTQRLDFSTLHRQLSLNSTPTKAPNPFLDEALKDIQPSPINPFISFFEEQERRSQHSSVSSGPGSSQRNSISILAEELDTEQFEDYRKKVLQADVVEQLKQIQIEDPDSPGSPSLPDDPLKFDEPIGPTLSFTKPQPKEGWPMLLRIPEKKNIMSSRHWGPIYVKVTEAGFLQLFYEKGLEKPFREFKLEVNHEISDPKLQNYDENGRIHTIRIDRVLYREKRKYQPMPLVTHTGEREQTIKLGTADYLDLISFISTVQDILFHLPPTVDLSTMHQNYIEEEITVDVKDEFRGILAKGDNQLLQHSVVTHVHVLSFISGMADCRIGLNDVLIKGNEVVSRHDIMPTTTTKWVRLHDCQFHSSVDEEAFHSLRNVLFTPIDACRFELMRFQTVFSEKTLPFTLRTVACVRGAEVELQSWVVMSTGFSSNRDALSQVPCENISIRHPVPPDWVNYFRRDSVLGERSLKAKVNREASFGSPSFSGSEPAMRVTLGTAKYEHAYNAIVWRISRLPDKNSGWGHPHCFYCHLELGSDREVPPVFAKYVEVEFSMPAASASKTAVRSISVEEKTELKKWVNYSAHYYYKVEIEQKKTLNPETEEDPPPDAPTALTAASFSSSCGENKLMQSKAVDGFHSEEQQLLLQSQQQQQQQHHHHHHHVQTQPPQTATHQAPTQQVLIPAAHQASQQQVLIPSNDSKLIQHMAPPGMSAAATAATLALPAGVTPVQQLITNSGQLLQVVRAANGAQYIIQQQQPMVLQQQMIPQMQPGGVQAPVIQQVLAPLPGGLSQQTGVIIQPQQILFTGNKTQVIPTTVSAPQAPVQGQLTMANAQQQGQQQAPLVLQVDGAGDTSSEEDEEEDEDYDDEEEEDKEKDGEDGQVEEEPLNSEDDVSDEEGQELFDTENVVVCQYDKIHRSKNKWKFHLKDGIMNLNGRDFVFSKAIGDAEW